MGRQLQIRGTVLGVPIIRIAILWGLYWVTLFRKTTKYPLNTGEAAAAAAKLWVGRSSFTTTSKINPTKRTSLSERDVECLTAGEGPCNHDLYYSERLPGFEKHQCASLALPQKFQ